MLLRRGEGREEHAYNFTHGSKQGGKKGAPTQAIQGTSQLCFPTSPRQCISSPYPLAEVPSSTPLGSGLKVFVTKKSCTPLSFHANQTKREAFLLLHFSMNDSAKLNSVEETRCSNTVQTLNLNKIWTRTNCTFLHLNQQRNLSESLRRKIFLVSETEK